jgi:hypothetical protein
LVRASGSTSTSRLFRQQNSKYRGQTPEIHFEMVEKGFVTEQDFREFTFTNAAVLHTRNNPGFFKGTVVEQAVADELGLERASPAATA